jgi:hypothetical protein
VDCYLTQNLRVKVGYCSPTDTGANILYSVKIGWRNLEKPPIFTHEMLEYKPIKIDKQCLIMWLQKLIEVWRKECGKVMLKELLSNQMYNPHSCCFWWIPVLVLSTESASYPVYFLKWTNGICQVLSTYWLVMGRSRTPLPTCTYARWTLIPEPIPVSDNVPPAQFAKTVGIQDWHVFDELLEPHYRHCLTICWLFFHIFYFIQLLWTESRVFALAQRH